MASTKAPPTGRHEPAQPQPAQQPAFPGCKSVRLPRTELERFEGRLEYWDSSTETAWICEPATPYHERPSRRLTRLAGQVAAVRGSPIECYGSMDLLLRDPDGEPRRIMQADESVYLHPAQRGPGPAAMVVGEDDYPDVVLEVDHTTDVHRGKLALYESWGFPEVWVEVPDAPAPSRPHRRRPGLTIHLLEHGGFRVSAGSRALPGWRGGGEGGGRKRFGGPGGSRYRRRAPARRCSGLPERSVHAKERARTTTCCSERNAARDSSEAVRRGMRKVARGWSIRSFAHGASKCRRDSTPPRTRLRRRPGRRCWRRPLAARMRRNSWPRSGDRATQAPDCGLNTGQPSSARECGERGNTTGGHREQHLPIGSGSVDPDACHLPVLSSRLFR